MGLQPLEFSDCLTDSPYFREKLHTHEKELDRTSKAIKVLISECKDLINAAKALSKAQRQFSKTLVDFKFECIGSEQTDDESVITDSLGTFGRLISQIEDQRDMMLDKAYETIISPLENFRKNNIGSAKEGKKKFDKNTAKFCTALEKYLNMKTKTSDNQLSEADLQVEMERRQFYQASMEYVLLLQEVQETKKFEFVEILLRFIYQWLTFYHLGHDVSEDFKPFMSDLQERLQNCRCNYDATKQEAEQLKQKMLEVRGSKQQDTQTLNRTCTKEGYLFLLEKKALGTTSWTKQYCQYQKENKILTMIPYNQVTGKGIAGMTTDTMVLLTCTRRASDTIEKRFCFDITVVDRNGSITLQALSEDDRKSWMDAMDGKEPIYSAPVHSQDLGSLLDDIGFSFIRKCIHAVEKYGLEEQGLYRVVGVTSKVTKLTSMGLDRRRCDKINFDDSDEWETKTITSALKNYFRNLPEPLMTFKLHTKLIVAAKRESKTLRMVDIHELVHELPEQNFEMLEILIAHLKKVSEHSHLNLMTVPNIGVCFGPTLMRPKEETMAAIMDIKWCNIVVEILIDNFDKIFHTSPNAVNNVKPPAPPTNMSTSTPNVLHRPDLELDRRDPATYNSISMIDTNQTYAQYRAKLRPTTGFYSQFSPGDHNSSRSSSTESLTSRTSSIHHSSTSINNTGQAHLVSQGRGQTPLLSKSEINDSTNSVGSLSSGHSVRTQGPGRRVRALFQCDAENSTELSFEPNQIIYNVRQSREPGWLEGVLDGKMGLIPANYVEYI